MTMPKCHGLQNGHECGDLNLIEAHIVPRAFARQVRDVHHNIEVTAKGAKKARNQLGIFDIEILCAACDSVLGAYDKYGIETCRNFSTQATRNNVSWEMRNVDGDLFAKCILSILWRASISKRRECETLCLGPYENIARDVLYGLKSLALMPAFEVMLARYESNWFNTERFYTDPGQTRFGEYKGYSIGIGGFRVFAKMDSRSFPKQWTPFVVNGNDTLRGYFQNIENTNEYDFMVQALTPRVHNR
jgi:hypothetical protein